MKRKRIVATILDFILIALIAKFFWSFFENHEIFTQKEWYRFIKIWVIGLFYFSFMEGFFLHASLGKIALGLKITLENGEPVKSWIMPIRYTLFIILMPLNIILMIFFWNIGIFHDRICKTKVIIFKP